MKITKRQLRRIIKEEKAKLLQETVADQANFEALIAEVAQEVSELFDEQLTGLFKEDPEMFAGRSTEAEWTQQVGAASDALADALQDAISRTIESVEMELHDGQFLDTRRR